MKAYLLSFALLFSLAGNAQTGFPRLFLPVSANGQILTNPFTGGLNNPQPSKADLNNDGIEDLFIFDRFGNIPLTFIHSGQAGTLEYAFAPEYAANFPPMVNWVLLRDYNGDGIMDIFTHNATPVHGIKVFTGYYDADNRIAFEPFQFCCELFNIIYYELANGSTTQVYVSPVDYPEIVDVDGDGDMDILTFAVAGGYVEYFQNRSMQLGFGKDSLIFKRQDNCWGKFYESSFSEEIVLSASANQCATGFTGDPTVEARHPGSTLAVFDSDNDGDLDLLLADVSFPGVTYLHNGGTPQNAFMVSQDNSFPSYDVPVNIPLFPVPFTLDLDNDGKVDFVAAPNQTGGTPNYEVFWFYKNVNTHQIPIFELVKKNALLDQMLDFGGGSHPVFADINGDGLLDIIVGTDGYYSETSLSSRDPRLILLLNTGTPAQPAFEITNGDFLEMSQYGNQTWNFAPAVGDLDNDGDIDLIVGEQDGRLVYFENLGGAGNPAQFGPAQFFWKNIDVGLNSHPFIVDLNRDGLPDLVIGERNGNFNFLPNIGTASQPDFQSDLNQAPNNQLLGLVSTELPADLSAGNSAPFFLDYGDSFLLVSGTQAGPVQLYSDIENNLSGMFTLAEANFGGTREGKRSTVALADLDGDGLLEMLVGNSRGGLSLFSTTLDAADPSSVFAQPSLQPARIYPNPARDQITFEWNGDGIGNAQVRIISILGGEVGVYRAAGAQWTLDVSALPTGMYFVEISDGLGRRVVEKVVVSR